MERGNRIESGGESAIDCGRATFGANPSANLAGVRKKVKVQFSHVKACVLIGLCSISLLVLAGCGSRGSETLTPAPGSGPGGLAILPSPSASQQPVAQASQVTLAGTVTAVLSSEKFVYQTGSPHGAVPVLYSESMVVPKNGQIAVGSRVSVVGKFNSNGTLSASSVTIGSSGGGGGGTYHIAVWVNDLYGGEGSKASGADVSKYASYAESGFGNSKAADDCTSSSGCKSVLYFDPSKVYASARCPFMPDALVLQASSEGWFVHQKGYSDKGHRVNGKYQQDCLGSTISIPVYEPNDAVAGVQAWWRTKLQSDADNYDVFFMDDTQATVPDQYYFTSGGGCLPWPSLCTTTQEVPNDTAVVSGHAHFVDALNHRNGQAMQFAFNSLNFDGNNVSSGLSVFNASARFVAGICEGCAVSNGRIYGSNYIRILDTMNAIRATQGAFVLHSTDSAGSGSSTQIFERVLTTGLVWLGYEAGHTVAWPDLEDHSTNLAVWPEDLLFPSSPIQSMTSGAGDLQVASGVWRREFRTCYQKGTSFGRCAAIVNSNSGTRTVASGWLSQNYSHIIEVSGGDVLSGGNASVSGTAFRPGSTTVPPYGALLIAE